MLLAFSLAKSQHVDWNQINSATAVEMMTKQSPQSLSFEPSASSTIVLQNGYGNNADLQLNSKTQIVVQQLGDQNSIYFNNSFSTKENKSAITTQGNNNMIDITGSNSISDGLHLNIKSDNKTIFMRNY